MVQIQNTFTDLLLIVPSTKITQMVLLCHIKVIYSSAAYLNTNLSQCLLVLLLKCLKQCAWAGPEFLSVGVQLWHFFLSVDEERKDTDTTISKPSSACQRNAILMAFHWRVDNGLTLNAGFVLLWFSRGSGPVLLRNPTFSWFCRGGPDPMSPPLWISTWCGPRYAEYLCTYAVIFCDVST